MNKRKKIICLLMMFALLTPKVYADCSTEELKEWEKVKDDYKVTYEFDKETKTYTIYFYGSEPTKFNYVFISSSDIEYVETDESIFALKKITPGEYEIEIIGITDTCDNTLYETTLKLPKYNEYSEDPLCVGYEEFVLCQPTYDKEIDYETFKSRLETYKNTKAKEELQQQETIKEKTLLDKTKEFINKNKQIIIISGISLVGIILIIIIIKIIAKKLKKRRRLE